MRIIGLIGGMSWESSAEYYRIINQEVKRRLGGLHSADCVMYSFDFAEIEALQASGDWQSATLRMIGAAERLKNAEAECIVICTNTMHKMAEAVSAAVDLPLIHIADPTGDAITAQGIDTVGLLGTRFTMEEDFYKRRLEEEHGLTVLVPGADGRRAVDRIIYQELVVGQINEQSRQTYIQQITALQAVGAAGVILGCTEIGLLIKPEHSPIPTFDTTELHALAAVEFALSEPRY
jgi:aspartate racemase